MATIKQIVWEVAWLTLKMLILLFVLAVVWLIYDLAREGYSAFFMRFESEPKEGWSYWHAKRIREGLPSWLAVGGAALLFISGIVWSIFRSFKRLIG